MANDLIALIKSKQEAIAKLLSELEQAKALLLNQALTKPAASSQSLAPASARPTLKQRQRRRASRRTRPKPATAAGDTAIVQTSSVGRTVQVLKRAGKALHIDHIIRDIESEGETVNKTTLVGNLSRYVAARRVFYRASPSVFGLLEFKK